MNTITAMWRSSVGTKAIMALSGGLLLGWSALHAAGSLLVFADPALINGYGAALQGSPLLWGMRLGLLALLAVHVSCAVKLSRSSRASRGRARGPVAHRASTLASRSMLATGAAFLLFLVLHLLHLYGPLAPDLRPGDVHHNLSVGLSSPAFALLYVVGAGLYGLHLSHGGASALRSAGLADSGLARAMFGLAALITGMFLLPPLAGLAGWW